MQSKLKLCLFNLRYRYTTSLSKARATLVNIADSFPETMLLLALTTYSVKSLFID